MKKCFFKGLAVSAALLMLASSASAETMYVAGAETGAVYFRVSAGSDDNYGILYNGTPIESIGWEVGPDGEGYNQVVYNGQSGYITSRYLSDTDPAYSISAYEYDRGMEKGISYYNRGLYYEARDEFGWFKAANYDRMDSDQKAYLDAYINETQIGINNWAESQKYQKYVGSWYDGDINQIDIYSINGSDVNLTINRTRGKNILFTVDSATLSGNTITVKGRSIFPIYGNGYHSFTSTIVLSGNRIYYDGIEMYRI